MYDTPGIASRSARSLRSTRNLYCRVGDIWLAGRFGQHLVAKAPFLN